VLQDLRDLDYLMIAVLKRFGVAASFAMFLETPVDVFADVFSATKRKYGFHVDHDLKPGSIMSLFPGEKVSNVSPDFPLPDVDILVRHIARRIGTSIGVSWQVVLGDFSESTYSGGRLDQTNADHSYARPRQGLIEVLRWVRQNALEDALLRGDERLAGIPVEALAMVTAIQPAKVLVQPEKEAQAYEIFQRIGALGLREICAALGLDWEDVQTQKLIEEAREIKERERLGLPPPQVQAAPGPTAAPAAPPPDDEEDEKPARRLKIGAAA